MSLGYESFKGELAKSIFYNFLDNEKTGHRLEKFEIYDRLFFSHSIYLKTESRPLLLFSISSTVSCIRWII